MAGSRFGVGKLPVGPMVVSYSSREYQVRKPRYRPRTFPTLGTVWILQDALYWVFRGVSVWPWALSTNKL